jgi:hypothetical protein
VNGDTFATVLQSMVERNIRIGGNKWHPTVEDAVAVCESGLGYEGAMILATIADLAEEDEGDLPGALTLLQRQLKCGLPSLAALGFFEAGFADRVVAQALAGAFPDVADRQSARIVVRNSIAPARAILDQFPAYFGSVLEALLT